MSVQRVLVIGLCGIWAATAGIAGSKPVAVSPGSLTGEVIGDSCPTFSWGEVEGAKSYELVVYRIGAESGEPQPVWRHELPGSALGWTAPLDRCLERGERYAWSVRALGEVPSDWSAPSLFQVASGPSPAEFEVALEVVRQYLSTEGEAEAEGAVEDQAGPEPGAEAAATSPVPKSVGTTQLSVDGGVVAESFTGDGSTLTNVTASDLEGAACVSESELDFDPTTQAEMATHTGDGSAHHAPTVDTTCHGLACDGTNFANVQWGNLGSRPAGLDNGDDDTTYAAGPGLALTGTTFSLASGPVLAPMDNTTSTVDSVGIVGSHTSITLGADGLPVVSYHDYTNGDLKVAKCNDPACSGGDETLSTVDSGLGAHTYTSITLGADGLPVLSYFDWTNGDLKVAKCNDAACAGGDETISTVDSEGTVGYNPSITLGVDGLPIVSYKDGDPILDLKVAKCNDPACSGGDESISTVDSAGNTGGHPSITLGADGLPVISYRDDSNNNLKVAKCNDTACTGGNETLSTVESGGYGSSITLGTDGLPVISHWNSSQNLRVAKCNDAACDPTVNGAETLSTVDNSGYLDGDTSITLGADGLPVVSYAHYIDGLKVAKCNDPACSGGDETLTTVDGVGNVGTNCSITLGADGLPVISYYDDSPNYDLKVARCGSPFCVPYLRRR